MAVVVGEEAARRGRDTDSSAWRRRQRQSLVLGQTVWARDGTLGKGPQRFYREFAVPHGWRDGPTRACGFVIFKVFRCLPQVLGVRPCAHACIGADARRLGQIQGAFLACHCHGGALVSCRLPFWRCGSDDVLVGVLTCSACGRLGAACSWLGSTDDQWGGAEGGVRPAVAMQRLIQESSVLRWPPNRSNAPIVSGKAQCNARERLPTGIGALSRSGREKPVPTQRMVRTRSVKSSRWSRDQVALLGGFGGFDIRWIRYAAGPLRLSSLVPQADGERGVWSLTDPSHGSQDFTQARHEQEPSRREGNPLCCVVPSGTRVRGLGSSGIS